MGPLADSVEHMVSVLLRARRVQISCCMQEQRRLTNPPGIQLTTTTHTTHKTHTTNTHTQMGNYYGVWDKKSPSPLAAIRAELGEWRS